MEVTIRHFDACACNDLFALFQNVYSTSEGMSETLAEKYVHINEFKKEMTRIRRLPGAITLAAVIKKQPVAYLIIKPRISSKLKHTAELNMGVAQPVRGQGIGMMILQTGLKRAEVEAEVEIVYLMVRSDNTPAVKLYQRMGFETLALLHRDIKIDGRYFDGLLMRRFIKDSDYL